MEGVDEKVQELVAWFGAVPVGLGHQVCSIILL